MNDAPVERDARLAALLADLTTALRSGGCADVEAAARAHPDLADELRSLWAAAQIAEAFAGLPADPEVTMPDLAKSWSDLFAIPPTALPLPRPFGEFELLAELGRGGMGVVYKARDRRLDRVVALKMVLAGELASATDRDRFRAEAEAAARLNHPNIVQVYEVGEQDGQAFFAMQLIAGQTLAKRVAGGPLPTTEAARIVAAVASGVEHAHRQGILHRDLKPSNILLDAEGTPHVSDFGLAKRVRPEGEESGPKTRTGAILGTPSYMPPEQAAGNRGLIGPAADVWALGAILYECLTGRPPFQAANPIDTVLMVLEQEPVPPRLLNPRVDCTLEAICLKCLQKPIDLRYPSAADLAADLTAFLKGEPVSFRPRELRGLLARVFRETHHAAVLENWGVLWMAHSVFVLLLCGATWVLQMMEVTAREPYFALWGVAVLVWSFVFWEIRKRAGPITFVERQIAHAWAAGVAGTFGVLVLEWMLGLPVLTLAPLLAVVAAMVFVMKAGILSGEFYLAAAGLFATSAAMAWLPGIGILLHGAMLATCYFVPGWKYHRRRQGNSG